MKAWILLLVLAGMAIGSTVTWAYFASHPAYRSLDPNYRSTWYFIGSVVVFFIALMFVLD